jgi:hypothetical protein
MPATSSDSISKSGSNSDSNSSSYSKSNSDSKSDSNSDSNSTSTAYTQSSGPQIFGEQSWKEFECTFRRMEEGEKIEM